MNKKKPILTTKNIEKHIRYDRIVQVEAGEDFQQYKYKANGKPVPKGTSIGYEKKVKGIWVLVLCENVDFAEDHKVFLF